MSIFVENYGRGRQGTLLTIRQPGSLLSETDAFFAEALQSSPEDARLLALKLENMIEKSGFQDYYFKTGEGSRMDNVCALSQGKLRLYCLRYGNVLVVLGGGGTKTTRTYEEDPRLHSKVKTLQRLNRALDKQMREGHLRMTERGFDLPAPFEMELPSR